jgi:hypothetical protein
MASGLRCKQNDCKHTVGDIIFLFFLCLFAADSKNTNSPRNGSDLASGAVPDPFPGLPDPFQGLPRPAQAPEGRKSADPYRAAFICSPSP